MSASAAQLDTPRCGSNSKSSKRAPLILLPRLPTPTPQRKLTLPPVCANASMESPLFWSSRLWGTS